MRKGQKQTEESKARIRAGHLNKVVSDETRAKMSSSHVGQSHVVSDESRKKMSESHLGIKPTDEAREHMSESAKLRDRPAEYWERVKTGHAESEKEKAAREARRGKSLGPRKS